MPNDAPALSQIAYNAKAYWGYPEDWMQKWDAELRFPPELFEKEEAWLVESEGDPIAFYTLQKHEGEGWIENLWVDPTLIRKGVGNMLFMHAAARCRELGYRKLRLESDPNASGFYERMGMHQVGGRRADMDDKPRIVPLMEMEL